jgi:DNA-binding winged helix-turn-helix (wHTH) protein
MGKLNQEPTNPNPEEGPMGDEVGLDPIYKFGVYLLDSGERIVKNEGSLARLIGTPVELLLFLVENRGRCVPRKELFKKIWGGTKSYGPMKTTLISRFMF